MTGYSGVVFLHDVFERPVLCYNYLNNSVVLTCQNYDKQKCHFARFKMKLNYSGGENKNTFM